MLVNWASIKGPNWITPCYTHPPRTAQFASRDDTRNAAREYDSGRRSMSESSLDLGLNSWKFRSASLESSWSPKMEFWLIINFIFFGGFGFSGSFAVGLQVKSSSTKWRHCKLLIRSCWLLCLIRPEHDSYIPVKPPAPASSYFFQLLMLSSSKI